MPLGSGVHDIWTAPTMFLFGCQPLKVLQIKATFVDDGKTQIPVPVGSGESGAVRPTALLEIVTFVLLETAIPRSVPAPVIVLLAIVTLAALDSRIPVEFVPSGGVPAPAPITVLPVNVPPAPPSPYWTPLVEFKPGRASGGPIVLFPPTLSVIWPDPVTPFFIKPVTVTWVSVTVRAVPARALARIPLPVWQPECWVMSRTMTSVAVPSASSKKSPT